MTSRREDPAEAAAAPALMWARMLRPGFVVMHLVVVALFVVCLQLGWWQWERAVASDWSPQNVSYAVQWPVYGLMGLWFYGKMMHAELERDPDADDPGSSLVLYQQPRIDTTGDPELAAYNAYLAELNERVLRQRRP